MMAKKLLLGLVLPVLLLSSCDFDGTEEAAEAGRNYAIKEYVWANTSPDDSDYDRLSRELKRQRDEDYARYFGKSKTRRAYEDARMEQSRKQY